MGKAGNLKQGAEDKHCPAGPAHLPQRAHLGECRSVRSAELQRYGRPLPASLWCGLAVQDGSWETGCGEKLPHPRGGGY